MGGKVIAGKWELTVTETGGRPGTNTFDNEPEFLRALRNAFAYYRVVNVSAVLDDGAELDMAALKTWLTNRDAMSQEPIELTDSDSIEQFRQLQAEQLRRNTERT